MRGCIPPNALDRWSVEARLIAHSGGLATIELAVANQVLGAFPSFCTTIEWKPGMEAADVEARALLVAAQSLRCLSQACADVASRKIE
jgi:hypothetical protein